MSFKWDYFNSAMGVEICLSTAEHDGDYQYGVTIRPPGGDQPDELAGAYGPTRRDAFLKLAHRHRDLAFELEALAVSDPLKFPDGNDQRCDLASDSWTYRMWLEAFIKCGGHLSTNGFRFVVLDLGRDEAE